jgi:hypothetical protein
MTANQVNEDPINGNATITTVGLMKTHLNLASTPLSAPTATISPLPLRSHTVALVALATNGKSMSLTVSRTASSLSVSFGRITTAMG